MTGVQTCALPILLTFVVNACYAKKSVEYNLHDLEFDVKMKIFKLGQLVGGGQGREGEDPS